MTLAVVKRLLSTDRPWYGVSSRKDDLLKLTQEVNEGGGLLRCLDAVKARTVDELFDSVSSVLEFPDYFGSNWAALDECLRDLDWLPPSDPYVLILLNAAELLADEAPSALRTLLEIIAGAAETWGRPVELGEWWDRPARAFHVLFQEQVSRREELVARFRGVDHQLEWIELA
ncbi:MAG: barstar family protein [Acidimicrobiales bacterium]